MTDITPENGQSTTSPPDLAGSAKQMLDEAGRTVKQEAAQFAGSAQEKAKGALDRQKETATRTLGDFADAVRKAGDELNQRDQSMAGRLIGQAADSLEGLSRSMADKRPEELLESVRDFGRRNPVAFIGGAVLVGLAVGRFARASAQDNQMGQTMSRRLGEGGGDWRANETWAGGAAGAGQAYPGAEMGDMAGEGGQTSSELYRDDLASEDTLNTASGSLGQGGLDGGGAMGSGESAIGEDIERADGSGAPGRSGRTSTPEV